MTDLLKNPNRAGCNVMETIYQGIEISARSKLTAARKKACTRSRAYENEARVLKILEILGFSRYNEGTIVDGAVNNPNPTGCNVKETISVLKFP